jgi:chromosome segregation protein
VLLKSLELQGFKTFPDKTKLTFDNGITAVVGPNGSGKSNISDAIRWVLGEQSTKNLRCTKMEDVVFNGTDGRKRQGFAEVTLTIENKDRALGFDKDEVAITRRYYRSGESEYLINKTIVRLKDVHEMFMDTGLGRDGYSMIGQGKIDAIVSSKSEDRREIFEEAAGISRYRYKKTEATRKLLRTEENLVRLRDIVAELEVRVEPLKEQSQKAEEFLRFSQEKQGLEIALWLITINKFAQNLRAHEDKILVCQNQQDEFEQSLDQIGKAFDDNYLKNAAFATQTEELRLAIAKSEEENSQRKAEVSVMQNDILHKQESAQRLQAEIERILDVTQGFEKEIESKKATAAELLTALEQAKKECQSYEGQLLQISQDSGQHSGQESELTTQLVGLNQTASEHKIEKITSLSSQNELNQRTITLTDTLTKKQAQHTDTTALLQGYEKDVATAQQKIEGLKNAIAGFEMKLAARAAKRDAAKQIAEKTALEVSKSLAHIKLLEDLERNLEGFSYSVKKVMQHSKSGELGGVHGPVSRLINVPQQYSTAIEIALGGAMQNIVTSTDTDAKRAIDFLKKADGGRATFLPINTINGKTLQERGLDDCYGFVGIAAQLCGCDDKYTAILNSLLGRIVVAEDLNAALTMAKRYNYSFKIVTLDGQVVNAGGSLTGGSFGKKSGLLSRAADIEASKQAVAALQKQEQEQRQALLAINAECAALEAEVLGNKGDLTRLSQELVMLQAEQKAAKTEQQSLLSDIEAIQSEIAANKEKTQQLSTIAQAADDKITEIEKQVTVLQVQLDELNSNKKALLDLSQTLTEQLQNKKLQSISLQKDIDSLNFEIESAKALEQGQSARVSEIEAEIAQIEETCKEINEKIAATLTQIDAAAKQIEEYNLQIAKINEEKTSFEAATVELRKQEREIQVQKEQIVGELSRLQERKLNSQKQYDEIIQKLWDEYELTPRKAEEQAAEIESVTAAQKRLAELKRGIKALGSINVAAIEEYKEVSQRYEFLSVQLKDVEKSKKDIENIIADLTKQMKEIFMQSFAEINSNFTHTFRELFGGGTAALSLSDPEDVLNTGIDILVHPPGKIVAHLEALSGGEKALVAIAIYFAIMKVRPAPFCVMDEIEAALDEMNVDKFAQYLRRLTASTQFILITHRRGTMEEADVLYGVTMQDEGVSKMLELRASEAVKMLGGK